MTEFFLNVAAVRRRTRVNGPGLRNAVWVQGCSLRCPGCFNPETHAHEARRLFDPEVLADQLVPESDVEGITILGGEPFEQAAACAKLARRAQIRGASVVTYSGYSWRILCASQTVEVRELLAATDLLIAGPYVAALAQDGRGWHGSTNQEFVFLTSRYDRSITASFDELPVIEVRTDGVHEDWTGIPGAEDNAPGGPSRR